MDQQISCIITCYNLEKYLDECIHSIRSQTVQPKEIILVHDGCTAPKIYDDVKVISRTFNKGVSASRNEAFNESKEEYILFIDADDVLPENYLEEMLETIKTCDVAYPDVLLWCYWGEEPKANRFHKSPKNITLNSLKKFNKVVVPSLMRSKVFKTIGGFIDLEMYEDWDFFLSAVEMEFKFKRANTYLKYRQRTGGRNRKDIEVRKAMFKKILSRHA